VIIDVRVDCIGVGIRLGIMGLAAYVKTNLEDRQREHEYQKRIEHRVIPKEQPDLIKPYIQKYEKVWHNAKKV